MIIILGIIIYNCLPCHTIAYNILHILYLPFQFQHYFIGSKIMLMIKACIRTMEIILLIVKKFHITITMVISIIYQ